MTTWKTALATCICVYLTHGIVPAGADEGKPRYVAGAGRDSGDCRNRFRPCRSLSYAIAQAGKGDSVLVAEGEYVVESARDLEDLLTVNGRLTGGFTSYSGYSEQSAVDSTVVIGVPPALRERYETAGFTVIVDTKSLNEAVPNEKERRQMNELATQVRATEQSHSSAACVGGSSSGFPCQSVSLLAHMSLQDMTPVSPSGNDVWGFVDLNTGREYALAGLQNGIAVVDVTDPAAPVQVGSATGASTTWRDVKVLQRYDAGARRWRAYAYVTADSVVDRLLILDLSALPNGISGAVNGADFLSAHNVYVAGVDYTYGIANGGGEPLLGIAGSAGAADAGGSRGRFRLYSLAQPDSPSIEIVSTGGYAHDLASVAVTDARKDSQCVNAHNAPACELLADFNEDTVDIWDVTDPNDPRRLASQDYPNASYVHSGWFTEDGRYLFVQDELDEQGAGLNTTVRVLDLAVLSAPALAATWTGPARAIDHNGFAKGNRYYVSNYGAGLTVLDITDPLAPQRVGFFDTYPTSDPTEFVGAWGAYPFFASGTIAVSDRNSGLYLLENETLSSPNGSFAVLTPSVGDAEGQSVQVAVGRLSGSTGAVSVDLEVLYATAGAADATLSTQTLSWPNGDAAGKVVSVDLVADGLNEDLERLLVRLKNPRGGATLGYPDTAHVHIFEPGAGTRLGLLQDTVSVDEARGEALIVAMRRGSAAGEARVRVRTLAASYAGFAPVDTELVWADGDVEAKTLTVDIDAGALSAGESANFQVELYSPTAATLEDASGTDAATLLATVTVRDNAAPPPPSPPPSPPPASGGGGGGGGAIDWIWLLGALGLAALRRRDRYES